MALTKVKHNGSQPYNHGRSEKGKLGQFPPPLEFENMTSYAASVHNTPKFSVAPSALAANTPKWSLKRQKHRNYSLASSTRRKRAIFVSPQGFVPPPRPPPPLEILLRAPMRIMAHSYTMSQCILAFQAGCYTGSTRTFILENIIT